ncbi:pilin [Patescibacteria group bacterium]|nr:pilin [Patescibacteria group bacterium]
MKQKTLPAGKAGKIYIALILIFIISGCLLSFNSIQAQVSTPTGPMPTLDNPLGDREPHELVGDIIAYILGFVGVLALVMFIYGGITWMTSAGAPEKIKKGRDTIVWAIFGLAFVFLSYAILDFILNAFLTSTK